MTVAVDAMAGDNAPAALVAGAVAALQQDPRLAAILVGREEELGGVLAIVPGGMELVREGRLTFAPASRAVAEGGNPALAVRRDRRVSVASTARLVREGRADAGISVGNTGATLAAATIELGLLPGVHRPTAGTTFPFAPQTFVADLGPNTEVTPPQLLGIARLGAAYVRALLEIQDPTVALLSNGREPGKGTRAIKEAHALLAGSDLTFIGNIEPQDLFQGAANVVVTDGFVGNIVLKVIEGFARMVGERLAAVRAALPEWPGVLADLGAFLHGLADITRVASISAILGVNGLLFPGHGRAQAAEIAGLVHQAARVVRSGLYRRLSEAFRGGGGLAGADGDPGGVHG